MMMTMMGFDMIDASCFWNDSSLNYIISYMDRLGTQKIQFLNLILWMIIMENVFDLIN